MASSDPIVPSAQEILVGDVEANRAVSEAVQSKIGGTINKLLESLFFHEGWAVNGFFSVNAFDNGVGGIRRITRDSDILEYYLSIRTTGSAGTNGFNVAIYDNAGGFVNNLFGVGGNALTLSGANGTDSVIGRDVENATTFTTNTGGHTIQYGVLNVTTLLAGYILIPFVENSGTDALNLYFNLKLREQ